VHAQRTKRKRVFFWFVCSALGGVCAREMFVNTPEQVTDMTYKIAEAMTERWMADYENENGDIPAK
jgi:hypothetical protein